MVIIFSMIPFILVADSVHFLHLLLSYDVIFKFI